MKSLCSIIAVLLVALIFTPCAALAQSKQDAKRIFNEAQRLRKNPRSAQDLQRAVDKYHQLLRILEQNGSYEGAIGEGANILGSLYEALGQYAKAVEYYKKSLAITRKLGDLKGEGLALGNLGGVYGYWGQYQKAVDHYEMELATARRIGVPEVEEQALMGLGNVYSDMGEYAKAVEYYEKSLAIYRKLGDLKGEGQTLGNLGIVYYDRGQYSKAVGYYEKSLAICRKLGDLKGEGQSLNNLANVYSGWGQNAKAVEYNEKSLAICRKLGDLKGEGQSLNNLGNVYAQRGETAAAMKNYEQALSIGTKIGVSTAWTKGYIAAAYLDQGDLAKAEPLVKQADKYLISGRFYLAKGDHARAKHCFQSILASAEKSRDVDRMFTSYAGLGMAYEGLGDNANAAEYFRKAVQLVETLRSGLNEAERETFFDVRIHGFYRTTPYEGLARVLTKMNKPLDALKQSEYLKARLFAEAVSKRSGYTGTDVPREIRDKDSALTNELAALSKNLQKAYEKGNKEVIASLEPQVKQAKDKLAAHVKMLRDKYPLFAATKYPQPMDLAQTALKDNEWVLSYDVGRSWFHRISDQGQRPEEGAVQTYSKKGIGRSGEAVQGTAGH